MKAVIIEDELLGRNALVNLLVTYAENVTVVGEADDIESGIELILEEEPDLVFLDIRLGNRSGFDIIRKLPSADFSLIITTAYEEYAIEAFKVDAIDYLLKPVTKEDLLSALHRIQLKILSGRKSDHGALLKAAKQMTDRMAIPSTNGLIFISLQELIRCEADGPYTRLIFKSALPLMTTRNLGEYEKNLLPELGFIRIHQSVIVNIKEIIRYIRGEGGQVVMTDGAILDVSRRKKNELMEWVERI
jgi:two-component system, LytTR family, response regulator